MGYKTEGMLLEAICEMEDICYSTLKAALKDYTATEVLDIWLRYEGIAGYTARILQAMELLATLTGGAGVDDSAALF